MLLHIMSNFYLCNQCCSPIKGGVDAKELFHLYIVVWIQDKRLALLERCKLDKVMILIQIGFSSSLLITEFTSSFSRSFSQQPPPPTRKSYDFCVQVKWSGVRTQHSTTPFVDEMYDRLKESLNEYEVIICRWPEYSFALENVCF